MDVVSYLLGKKAGGGSPASLQEKSVTINSNGESSVTPDSGYDGLSKVNVTTNVLPNLESKSITITENTTTTVLPTSGKDGLSEVEIITNVSGGGTTEPEEKDVNFYNYDGTRLYSYTAQEFLALDSLPANPVNEGMTSQGWNWDYQEAINYVTEYGILDVGEICITNDNSTRIYVDLLEEYKNPYLGVYLSSGSVTVDWGDGTTDVLDTPSATNTTSHLYSTGGKKVIKIIPNTDNTSYVPGHGQTSKAIIYSGDTDNQNKNYSGAIYKVELGRIGNMQGGVFLDCINLKSVNFPNTFTYLGNNMFQNCNSLKHINLPKSLTYASEYWISNSFFERVILPPASSTVYGQINRVKFRNQNYIKRLIIPDLTNSTGGNANQMQLEYGDMRRLLYMVIPKNYTYIGYFSNCNSLKYLDLSHFTTVPGLNYASSNFQNTPSDFKIIVPDNLYETWIATSDWSTYSSKIIKKSDYDNL